MMLIKWIKKFLDFVKFKPSRRRKTKTLVCNELIMEMGDYMADTYMGDDYNLTYRVKKGKVSNLILQKPRKGEDKYVFHKIKVFPISKSALIEIIRSPLGGSNHVKFKKVRVWLNKYSKGKKKILKFDKFF